MKQEREGGQSPTDILLCADRAAPGGGGWGVGGGVAVRRPEQQALHLYQLYYYNHPTKSSTKSPFLYCYQILKSVSKTIFFMISKSKF